MEKISITYTYNVKYFVSEDICLTECGKLINVKKGIELKTGGRVWWVKSI